MENVLHKAETRGVADHGWLHSHHTFSFANYFHPERMGFGTHPHQNMEIISVPLSGSLKHKDTMGNDFVIRKGEVQAMSAGTGIAHSEYNNSADEDVNFLQIWVLPKKMDITPNYSQKEFSLDDRKNKLQLVVSPDGRDNSVEINQDAFFSLLTLDEGESLEYKNYLNENGVYFFVIDGELSVGDHLLQKRDGLGQEDGSSHQLNASKKTELLIMEVPMLK